MGKKIDLKLKKNQLERVREVLLKAIHKAGSQLKFSKMVGTHQPKVSLWLKGERILAEKAVEIEKVFSIDRKILRPDLFGELGPEKQPAVMEAIEISQEPENTQAPEAPQEPEVFQSAVEDEDSKDVQGDGEITKYKDLTKTKVIQGKGDGYIEISKTKNFENEAILVKIFL